MDVLQDTHDLLFLTQGLDAVFVHKSLRKHLEAQPSPEYYFADTPVAGTRSTSVEEYQKELEALARQLEAESGDPHGELLVDL